MQLWYNLHTDWHGVVFPADSLALWPVQDMCAGLCLFARLESLFAQLLSLCACSDLFFHNFLYHLNTPSELAQQCFICRDLERKLFAVSVGFGCQTLRAPNLLSCPKMITSTGLCYVKSEK